MLPNVGHADETLQYLEQAYRVVTGRGLVPWEYVVGARSWLIAGMLIPVFYLALAVSDNPATVLWVVTVFASALSLVAIVAAFALGRRVAGSTGGVFAGVLVAFWGEIVSLSPHVLADTISAIPLIGAVAIAYRRPSARLWELAATGAALGLTVALRPQLGPACLVAALWIWGLRDARRFAALAVGGGVVVALDGALDWLTWGRPFASTVTYLVANGGGVAALFGTQGPFFYLRQELSIWWVFTLPIVALGLVGARRLPLVAVLVVVIVATFSLVGHKEYRFIYPALPLVFTLCGVGSAEIVARLNVAIHRTGWSVAAWAVLAFWGLAVAVSAKRPAMHQHLRYGAGALAAIDAVNRDRTVCGVAVDPPDDWWKTGQVRLRRDLQLYRTSATPGRHAYNAVLAFPHAERRAGLERDGFAMTGCYAGDEVVCLYRRPDPCAGLGDAKLTADPDPKVARVLVELQLLPRG